MRNNVETRLWEIEPIVPLSINGGLVLWYENRYRR